MMCDGPMNIFSHISYRMLVALSVLVVAAGGFAWYHARSAQLPTDTMVVHAGGQMNEVIVSGTVQSAQNVDLGFAQSGRVAQIYAAVGDVVKAGTLLAEVDNGDARAALAQSKAALQAARSELASLLSGTRPEQIAVTQSQITGDESAIAQAEQGIVNAIQNAYTVSNDAVYNKTDSIFNNPQSLSPQLVFSVSDSQLASSIVNARVAIGPAIATWQSDLTTLSENTDLATSTQEAQSNLSRVVSYLSLANGVLNAALVGVQASQSTLNSYIASIATARANVNAAQTSLTAAQTAVQNARAALDRDQKSLVLEQAGSTSDQIATQQAQIDAAAAAVENTQAQLSKTQVTAPFDGIITRMDAKVGAVVSPNSPQISMISNGLFQIVSYIPEVEIAEVSIGQHASTTLDAYGPDVFFPSVVIAIDPGNTLVNGVSTYKTTLQFLANDSRIRSGMTAASDIATENATGTVEVPQGAVFSKGNTTVVQTIKGGAIVDVPVTLGSEPSVGDVEVLSGLHDGDTIVLDPITSR